MKKALVIIIVVALLGVVATYAAPTSKKPRTTTALASNPISSPARGASTNLTNPAPPSAAGQGSSTVTDTTAAVFKDGTFQGDDYSNPYGDVQVSVNISGGKITAVNFDKLTAEDRRSEEINNYAAGNLKQQTITAQSAQIDGVSGATFTSNSYIQSLQSALDKAKA